MRIKITKTLCPVCKIVIPADLIEKEGQIWMTRSCPSHGEFQDLYWADAEMYKFYDKYDTVGKGVENPNTSTKKGCPDDCGLCENHKSTTLLANIDLTNRCNLNCDFCFANAQACGYIYEPTFEQIVDMLVLLREEKPVPAPAVQFSGGEPTMREDLPEIVKKAQELGFQQIQIATNGIRLANEPGYAKVLKDIGVSTIYLHFDGVTKETNPLLSLNLKAVENCASVELGIVLVPTVIKDKNSQELGDIVRFAADNINVIRGVNFQPIAFTGAASEDDIKKSRITIPEVVKYIEIQTDGIIKKEDFYPVPCVVPFSELVEAYTGKPVIKFTAHQHCGAATYIFVTDEGIVPINRMVDVETFFKAIERMAERLTKGGSINKSLALIDGVKSLRESVKKAESPKGGEIWKLIGKALISQNFDALRDFHWNALFIGTMHFMDRYNYDLARVERCCIHYATPDGTLIPFCTYNSGPVYREQIWQKYKK